MFAQLTAKNVVDLFPRQLHGCKLTNLDTLNTHFILYRTNKKQFFLV